MLFKIGIINSYFKYFVSNKTNSELHISYICYIFVIASAHNNLPIVNKKIIISFLFFSFKQDLYLLDQVLGLVGSLDVK